MEELLLYNKKNIDELLVTGKYSFLFEKQFIKLANNGMFGFEPIAREIRYLEGSSAHTYTKKETLFKCEKLKGLWHKHFFNAFNIPQNCINALRKNFNSHKQKLNYKSRDFISIFDNIGKDSPYTGEWIIYKKGDSGNLYLTFAFHNESDEQIFERIKPYLTNG